MAVLRRTEYPLGRKRYCPPGQDHISRPTSCASDRWNYARYFIAPYLGHYRRDYETGHDFNHPDPADWPSAFAYRELQKAPDYRADQDLFIVDPDGRYAAGCISFTNPFYAAIGFKMRNAFHRWDKKPGQGGCPT